MIRKSRMGKRIMALFLCAALTFSNVIPTMAAEVNDETAVVTQGQDTAASDSSDTAQNTSADEAAKQDPSIDSDTEKNASGGDFSDGVSDNGNSNADVSADDNAPSDGKDTSADTSDADPANEAQTDTNQTNANQTDANQTDTSSDISPSADPNDASAGALGDEASEDLGAALLSDEEPVEEEDASEVASIEIWSDWPGGQYAEPLTARYFCKDFNQSIWLDELVILKDASGNTLERAWNNDFHSATNGHSYSCVLKQGDTVIEDTSSLAVGTYTVEYAVGDVTASYSLFVQSVNELDVRKLDPSGTEITATRNETHSNTYYRFTPEVDGKYYLSGTAGSAVYTTDGYCETGSTKLSLTAGKEYFFNFYGYINENGDLYNTYTVTLSGENTISSFSVSKGETQYIHKFINDYGDLKGWSISLDYADGSSKEYNIAKMSSRYWGSTETGDTERILQDDYRNEVDLQFISENSGTEFPSAGNYTVKITAEGIEEPFTDTISILDEALDTTWEGRELTLGSNSVGLMQECDREVYRFIPQETSKHVLQLTGDSGLVMGLDVYQMQDGSLTNINTDGCFADYETGVYSITAKLNSSEVYYFVVRRYLAESTDAVSGTLDITTVPSLQSATISTSMTELQIAERDSFTPWDVSYTLFYDDGSTNSGELFNSDWIRGSYSDTYVLKYQKEDDKSLYGFWESLSKGVYHLVLCTNSGDSEVICSYDGFTLTVVNLEEMVKGSLSIGANAIEATDHSVSYNYYYTYTPETTDYYYFTDCSSVYGFCFDDNNNKQTLDVNGTVKLLEGITYYFYFKGMHYNQDVDEYTYFYTVNLAKEMSASRIEIIPGKDAYVAYRENVFHDYEIKMTYGDGSTSSFYFGDCGGYYSNGSYYIYDYRAENRQSLRYELTEEETEGNLYKDASSPGVYTLKIYTLDSEDPIGTYTAEVKRLDQFDWTEYSLKEGENTILDSRHCPQMYYRFVADQTTPYTIRFPEEWDVCIYTFEKGDNEDEYYFRWFGDYERNWKNGYLSIAFNAPADTPLYFEFSSPDDDCQSTTINLEKCPTIESVSLVTNSQTTTKVLANASNANSVGWLKAVLTYSNGVVNTVTVDREGYVDGEYNGLALILTDKDGNTYNFTDSLPEGQYTVKAKITGTDPAVYSDNSYTITAASLDQLSAAALQIGDNAIHSGATLDEELNYDCLYSFQPSKTGNYLFTPAARIGVYTKDANGNLYQVGVYGSYKNGTGSAADVIIPLEEGTKYYLSLTGYRRDNWGVKNYSWTMQISLTSAITKATITGTMPYTTFYTGGYTKNEIAASVEKALESVQLSYEDGSTKTVSVDNYEILYPEEIGRYDCDPGVYTISVKLTIGGQSIVADPAFEITLLGGNDAKVWNISSPLTVNYDSENVEPGQAVLYRLTGLNAEKKYTVSTRNDIEMYVTNASSSIDGFIDCFCWDSSDLKNFEVEQEMADEEAGYILYIWMKPSSAINTFTVNVSEKEEEPVPVSTEIIFDQDDIYENLGGHDYLDTSNIYFRFTYENGETYTRRLQYSDQAYLKGEYTERLYGYDSFCLDTGSYTISAYGQEYSFDVGSLDVSSLPVLTADTVQNIEPGFYLFSPDTTGSYGFASTENSVLLPAFNVFSKQRNWWDPEYEGTTSAHLNAGNTYLIQVKGWSGDWRFGLDGKDQGYGDSYTEEDLQKTVASVTAVSDTLFYDTLWSEVFGEAEVTFTDSTKKTIDLGMFREFKYLQYTTSLSDDKITVYISYKSSADANADWIKCDPIELDAIVNLGTISVDQTKSTNESQVYYTFTPDSSGWYQLDIESKGGVALAGWQSADGQSGTDWKRIYLQTGKTYRVAVTLRDGAEADITVRRLSNVPASIEIDPTSSLTMAYKDYSYDVPASFDVSADTIRLTLTFDDGTKEVLTGKEFKAYYGDSITLDKHSDTRYTVSVSIYGTDAADTCTLSQKNFAENAYIVASDGSMSYSGTDIDYVSYGFNYSRSPLTLVIRPEKSGIYVMSVSGNQDQINDFSMNTCGFITTDTGRRIVDTYDANVVYLEAGKTYYQALNAPYYNGEYTLKLTPIDQFSSDCDHNYVGEVTKEPSCAEAGVKTFTCSICGASYTQPIAKLDHTEEVIEGREATCTEDGLTAGKKCRVCGEILEAQQTIPAGHKEEIVPGKEATCTETGLTEGKKCSVCGEVLEAQQEIPMKDHTEEIVPGKEATCTEAGLTEGKKCSVCDAVLVAQEAISAKGHSVETVTGTPATCTESGLTDGKRCYVCGTILEQQTAIPATGHTEEVTKEGREATCTQTGLTEEKTCTVCHVVTQVQTESPLAAHTEETIPGKAATCTETGLTEGTKCSVCDEILVTQEVIPAKGHTEVTIPGKEATCTETGLTDGTECSVCHEILVAQVVIPAKGHTEITIPGKEATCTETGLTDGTECSVCHETIVAQQVIAAKGHTEITISGKEATCTETGLTDGTECSVCHETIVAQQKIPAKGHTEVTIPGKEATCTETGLTEGTKCSVCDEILSTQEVIPAKGHTEVIIDPVPAGCETKGLTGGKKCSVCGEILIAPQEIPANGHVAAIVPGKEATCTETGLTEGKKCAVCGTVLEAQTEIPAKGHTEEKIPAVAATCTHSGLTAGVRCSSCGEILEAQQITPAAGHTIDTSLWITDEEKHTKYHQCTTCGARFDEFTYDEEAEEDAAKAIDQVTNLSDTSTSEDVASAVEALTNVDNQDLILNADNTEAAMETVAALEQQVVGKNDTVEETQVKTDETITNVTVSGAAVTAAKEQATDSNISEDTTVAAQLVVKTVETSSANELAVDVTLNIVDTSNNDTVIKEKVQPAAPISITMEIPEEYQEVAFELYHINHTDGTKEPISYKRNADNTITFVVTSLSVFSMEKSHECNFAGGAVVEEKAATCTEDGYKVVQCTVKGCIKTKTEIIPATGHTLEEIPPVPATCKEDGKTGGVKCSVCGVIITEQETISKLTKHTTVPILAKEATCTEDGYTEGEECTVCGTVTRELVIIPAKGHEEEVTKEGKAATCTETGLTEEKTCTVCHEVIQKQTEIQMLSHTEEAIPGKAATCTATGLTEGKKCSVCGTVTKEQEVIPVSGHTEVKIAGKAATCTATGLTEGKKCSVCGKILTAQKSIPALNHSFGNWTTTKAATVLATGTQTRTCSRCGYKEQRTIAKLTASGYLSIRNFPLKVKQSWTVAVQGMAAGDRVVSWQSSNTKIASITAAGKVTGKKKGNATITATLASGLKLSTTVKVQTGTVKTTSITVNTRNVTLKTKQGFQILATRNPATSQQGITYTTSNKKIATVSKKGYITGVKAGTATITVKSGSKSVKIKVKVEGVKTTGLTANSTAVTLKKNKSFAWKVKTVPANSSEKITYTTSNKKVATVSTAGKITAKKAGTATITAKSGTQKITIKVTVK